MVALSARAPAAQELPAATMRGDGYLPVRRPPKPGAPRTLDALERDAVERKLSCPCPCTLDVFMCRTSMPCQFSARMHTDVVALADGGHAAEEILAAFEETYGERVRMAPTTEGFNLVGWIAPFAALGTGALVVAAVIRRWARASESAADALPVDASPEELARLEAAVRGEDA